MKKWIISLFVLASVVGVWLYVRTYVRYVPEWDKAQFANVTRGDIRVPVTAPGLIEPYQRIEVKSEASGEVIEVAVAEGDLVEVGEVLVRLDPDDEERNVDRAKAGLTRAEALLADARIRVEEAHHNLALGQARVEELQAQVSRAEEDYKMIQANYEANVSSEQELRTARAAFKTVFAQLNGALASLEIAKLGPAKAEENVKNNLAAVEDARKLLEDAQQRLEETTIVSRHKAIVTDVIVRPGMLVQSATQTFSVGTPVMVLADITELKVIARVDEADYGRVQDISPPDALPEIEDLRKAVTEDSEGLKRRSGEVTLTVDAHPDEVFKGVIERVEPQGKLNTGSAIIQFDVHVRVTDERAYLLPLGTQAVVEFTVEQVKDTLLIPAEAAMTFNNERGVWIKTPAPAGSRDEFGQRFVPCRFGITDGANTQVIATLTGEELKDGQQVFIKLPPKSREEQD